MGVVWVGLHRQTVAAFVIRPSTVRRTRKLDLGPPRIRSRTEAPAPGPPGLFLDRRAPGESFLGLIYLFLGMYRAKRFIRLLD